jgi:hypothetical protein
MKFFTILLIIFSLAACTRPVEVTPKPKAIEGEVTETQYKKEMEEIRKSLKGDLKIKLKRDGKGAYMWEITGKDPQEILKANDTLRKRLGDGS